MKDAAGSRLPGFTKTEEIKDGCSDFELKFGKDFLYVLTLLP